MLGEGSKSGGKVKSEGRKTRESAAPARDLGDGDLVLVGSVQVDVITADAGGDGELEVLRLLDHLGGEVARVEGGAVQGSPRERLLYTNTTK